MEEEIKKHVKSNGLIEYVAIKKTRKILESTHYEFEKSELWEMFEVKDVEDVCDSIEKKDMKQILETFISNYNSGKYNSIDRTYGWLLIESLEILINTKNFNDNKEFKKVLVENLEKLKEIKEYITQRTTTYISYENKVYFSSIKDIENFIICINVIFENIKMIKDLFNNKDGIEKRISEITILALSTDDILIYKLCRLAEDHVSNLDFMNDYLLYRRLMNVNKIKILCPEIEKLYKEYQEEFNGTWIINIYEMIMKADVKFSDKQFKTLNIRNTYLHGDDIKDENKIFTDLKLLEFLFEIMLLYLLIKRKMIIINVDRRI